MRTITEAHGFRVIKDGKELYISKDPNNPVTTWYLINTYQAKRFVDKNITDTKEMITRINELAA